MEHATEMPIATVDFLVIIAKKKKIVAISQNNGEERNRLFTAYINRQGKVLPAPSTKKRNHHRNRHICNYDNGAAKNIAEIFC